MSDIPLCSKCKVKTEYDADRDEHICPICAQVYYPTREIVEYEDEFTSSHEDEQPEIHGTDAGVGLMAADDDSDTPLTDMLYRSAKHKPNMGEGAYRED